MTERVTLVENCQRLLGVDAGVQEVRVFAEFVDLSTQEPYEGGTAMDFAAYVVTRFAGETPASQRLHGSDMYLAYCCLMNLPDAIERLNALLVAEVRAVIRGRFLPGKGEDDLRQSIAVSLLAGGPDGVPKIGQYEGRSPLGAWLRVIAIRHYSRAKVGGGREVLLERELIEAAQTPDAELSSMKLAYRASFKQAFQAAFESLSHHDRLLLRQSVVDGLNIEALGRLHNMHRATAARHLAKVRDKLQNETRRQLQSALDLSPEDMHELFSLIQSHLDVSLTRLLSRGGHRQRTS